MSLSRLFLDPGLDRLRLRFALIVTLFAGLVGVVLVVDQDAPGAGSGAGPAAGPSATGGESERVTARVGARAELAAAAPARHTYTSTDSQSAWLAGTRRGTTALDGSLRMSRPVGAVTVGGKRFSWASWTGPWVTPEHGFTQLVPSWEARTPAGTWIAVQVRAKTSTGKVTTWQGFGRWTRGNNLTFRRSLGAQDDGLSTVATDTLRAKPGVVFTAYSLKVQVYRAAGRTTTPVVDAVGAVVSQLPSAVPPVSPQILPAKTLDVPAYSQMTHRGQYPQFGGGGQAWCSPTSLSMMLAYFGALPSAAEYAWVNKAYADPWVDEVARRVFDDAYDGAGNWPFNTAYAATRLPQAAVTRFASLQDVERFIAAGLPVQISISFASGQLTGAPIKGTDGHLLVVVGFTADGDVVVNDPAAPNNASVRRTYDRAELEAAWLRKSHGLAYVMRDGTRAFPGGYGLS